MLLLSGRADWDFVFIAGWRFITHCARLEYYLIISVTYGKMLPALFVEIEAS